MSEKILKTLAEQIEPEHTAVIVIDPQKDFCASDGAVAMILGKDVVVAEGQVIKYYEELVQPAAQDSYRSG